MNPADNIKRSIKKLHIEPTAEMDKRIQTGISNAIRQSKQKTPATNKPDTWRITMNNKITKLAVAAVVIIAVMIGTYVITGSFDGASVAWAGVVEAFKEADNIHVVGKGTYNTGDVKDFEWWLKSGNRIRAEYGESTLIDDGVRQLSLLHQENTARYKDSGTPHVWALLQVLRGEVTEYPTETKLLRETDDGLMVYEVKEHILSEGQIYITTAWVDPQSNLPIRVAGKHLDQETGKTQVTFEATCDYKPISDELFSTDLPSGYTEIN